MRIFLKNIPAKNVLDPKMRCCLFYADSWYSNDQLLHKIQSIKSTIRQV